MAEKWEALGQGCGCRIQGHGTIITYCPLHKAAPEILEALEKAEQLVGLVPELATMHGYKALNALVESWRSIIAQARGQGVGA